MRLLTRLILALGIGLFFSVHVHAQKKITGTVVDAGNSEPLPGVSIIVKGTTTGTFSNLSGEFALDVPSGESVVVISYIGYLSQEFVANQVPKSINLASDDEQLDEVVVTALGIKREEKALAYSISEVGGDAIRESNQTNVLQSLSGNVAGASVTQASGAAGGASRVVLRGFTSFGDNQALIVIDGVKVNNSEFNSESATQGVANSNRAIDINPEDIENVSVLKGGAATALYGVAGSNGVILITTKKGSKTGKGKFDVDFSTSWGVTQVSQLPELQDKFAQGFNEIWFGPETGASTSWGPSIDTLRYDNSAPYKFDENGTIVGQSDVNAGAPVNAYDNVGDFFQNGLTAKNNLSISGGNEVATFRFSVGNTQEKGVVPLNTFSKTNVGLASTLTALDNKLKLTATANYVNSGGRRIQQGSNLSGIMLGLLRTPATFDNSSGFEDPVNNKESYQFPDNSQRNYRGGGGYDNPYWVVNNIPANDEVNRILGSFAASYDFHKLFTLSTNIGADVYSDRRGLSYEIGSRGNPAGYVLEEQYDVQQFDVYLLASGNTKFGANEDFGFGYNAGYNQFSLSLNNVFATGSSLGFFGFPNLANTSTQTSGRSVSKYKSFSFFASAEFSYKNYLYLTLTGRQDYDSRFIDPSKELSFGDIGFFYPSAGVSFIFSELFLPENDVVTFGKLGISFAQVGKGPGGPYSTSTNYFSSGIGDGWTNGISFPYDGQTSYALSNTQGNNLLKPEITQELELNLNLKFFKGRIDLNASYYTRSSKDVILGVDIDPSAGFSGAFVNAAELNTNGIDIGLNITPVQTKDFNWTLGANFTQYNTVVGQLAKGLEQLFVGGFTGTGIYHVPGQEFGQIYGGAWLRDGSGNVVIESDQSSAFYGYPIADPDPKVIGNPNPDFTLGITNKLSYKSWNLSFLWDFKVGGQLWNGTQGALTFFGRSKLTENRDALGDAGSTVFDGVLGTVDANGDLQSTGETNGVTVPLNQNWYLDNGGGFGAVAEHFVQDANFVRLRNLNLSYNFSQGILKNVKVIKSLQLYFTANNVLLFTPYEGIDPETSLLGASSNGQGLDYFNMPNTKSYTVGVKIKL